MKKVLIIGGNRYFGKRLVNLLLENGDDVSVLNRGNLKNTFGNRVTQLIADRADDSVMKSAIKAPMHWDVIYDQCCQSPNEAKLACEVFAGKTERYIFTSSQSVYLESKIGLSESAFPAKDTSYRLGTKNDFDYAHCKRYAESYFLQEASFPVTAVRIPLILGPDDYTGRLEFHIDRVREGQTMVIENLNAQMSLMSSEDASKFLFWLKDQAVEGSINAASSGNPTIGEILREIEAVLGREADVKSSGADADYTPFVGPQSKTMSIERALRLSANFSSVKDWLPGLIRHLASQ
jgi:nucleoside-diphosphate-sugar epimerase